MASLSILTSAILLILAVIPASDACLCPPPLPGSTTVNFFQSAYHAADVIVKAKVLRERPQPIPVCLPPCLGPPFPIGGRRTYVLRLLRTFKGKRPSRHFTVETELDPVRCGITLQKGEIYMLNMSGGPGNYFVWLCQYNRLWSAVSRKDRWFLRKCAPGGGGGIKLCGKKQLQDGTLIPVLEGFVAQKTVVHGETL